MVEKENFPVENPSFKKECEKETSFSTVLSNPPFLALQRIAACFHNFSA
jgi:hypothetical protein